MSDPAKLKVKIGGAEFEAEGPADVVQDQLRQFMDALRASPLQTPTPTLPQSSSGYRNGTEDLPGGSGVDALSMAQQSEPSDSAGREELNRIFEVRKSVVALRLTPTGDTRHADALMLILYGHRVLRNEHQVGSTPLLEGMKITGLTVDRIDRIAEQLGQFVIRGGAKRGTRYALNNPGMLRSEELFRMLLNQ